MCSIGEQEKSDLFATTDGIRVEDDELMPETLDNIASIPASIAGCQAGARG
jgi:hypothetical protein